MITESYEEMMRREGYWTTNIQLQLFREIDKYLEENNMSRKDFAKKLGVSKAYVSQILNGEYDHKLSKLVRLALAMDLAPKLQFSDLESEIIKSKGGRQLEKLNYNATASGSLSADKVEALELLPIPEYA